ncbi:MAG: hypothetical protein ACLQDY_09080 [Streptosporangiaceae bacterium]
MRRHVMRALAAAVAAGGAVLLTAGAAGAATATAGPSTGNPVFYSTSQAGYVTTGRLFRFIQTTVEVAPVSSHGGYAEVVLGGTGVNPATLGVHRGGGAGSVMWNANGPLGGTGGGTMTLTPSVGDLLQLSVYYSQSAGRIYFTASDLTQKTTQTVSMEPGAPNMQYTAAEAAGLLTVKVYSPPPSPVRLWSFSDSHVTTYNNTKGTLNGPWTTNQVIDTTNGGSSGAVVMSPSLLWNNGQNFGVWLQPTA